MVTTRKYRKSKRQRRKERDRRERLFKILTSPEAGHITIKEIAQELGVSERTVYYDMQKLESRLRRWSKEQSRAFIKAFLEGRSSKKLQKMTLYDSL